MAGFVLSHKGNLTCVLYERSHEKRGSSDGYNYYLYIHEGYPQNARSRRARLDLECVIDSKKSNGNHAIIHDVGSVTQEEDYSTFAVENAFYVAKELGCTSVVKKTKSQNAVIIDSSFTEYDFSGFKFEPVSFA